MFHSWDRFILPYPFTEVLFVWGDPLYVPHDSTDAYVETARIELEGALLTLTEKADRLVCGD